MGREGGDIDGLAWLDNLDRYSGQQDRNLSNSLVVISLAD